MSLSAEKLELLLQRKGTDATIRIYPDVVFDPAENKTTLGTPVQYNIKVIPPYRNMEGFRNAELITFGSGWTGFANKNLQFDVKAGLVMIIGSKEWIVENVVPLSNNSGVLFYLVGIKSGN